MSWKEIEKKYRNSPERGNMTMEQQLQFVEDCFACYEQEGFAKMYWSPYSDRTKYIGKAFTVVGRVPVYDGNNDGADLDCLPMWTIRFEDGYETSAYPEEIVPSEMKANSCPEEYLRERADGDELE